MLSCHLPFYSILKSKDYILHIYRNCGNISHDLEPTPVNNFAISLDLNNNNNNNNKHAYAGIP